jgi:hypothetical protein
MSDILNLYETSGKLRLVQARQIPEQQVNFFDVNSQFQTQFEAFQKLRTTSYTDTALAYYDSARKNMVIPASYKPIEAGINLNRWAPEKKYYEAGQHIG